MISPSKKLGFIAVSDRVSIFRRDKQWYCNYQLNRRQIRRSLKTTSKKQAIHLATKLECELESGATPRQVSSVNVSEAVQAFRNHQESMGRARKTQQAYKRTTQRFLDFCTDQRVTRIEQCGYTLMDAFRAKWKKEGLTDNTIHDMLVVIRSVVLFAYRRKLSSSDPLTGYGLKKPKRKPQPCFSDDQVKNILIASPPTYLPLFTFLAETGTRINEARHMEWPDLDWTLNVIHIRAKPKHNWRPKSGDQRVVPISLRLRETLRGHSRSGNWLFRAPVTARNPQPGRQVSERRALSALKRVLKRLKILEGHLHTFRHSFISRALSAGVPEAVVRSWVGHVDDEVMKHYTHIADKTSQREMARLGTTSADAESISAKKEPTYEPASV